MTEKTSASKEENERQYKVIDQSLSMHSSFRDRMERRAFLLNTLLIASAIFLTVFAFVSDEFLRSLGIDPLNARFLFGIAAVLALICSITEFRVDWRSVAGRHSDAVVKLIELKAKYRKNYTQTNGEDLKKNAKLTTEYDDIMGRLPKIPDKWFNTLKAEHKFKRFLSERITQCPKTPIWFLRFQLRIQGILEAIQTRSSQK
ncbi:hypothetical protein ACFL54_04140 [Planctomycetota bacterium]